MFIVCLSSFFQLWNQRKFVYLVWLGKKKVDLSLLIKMYPPNYIVHMYG